MKHLFPVLLALLMLFSCALAENEGFVSGDFQYGFLKDGTVEIIGYSGETAQLDIPAEIDGKKVSALSIDAFGICKSLTAVSIPDSLTSIQSNPFWGCVNLTKVSVSPDHPTLAVIDGALYGKPRKRLIYAPHQVTKFVIPDGIRAIGDFAFYACQNMTDVLIPDSVTEIGDHAFYNCISLTAVAIPDSATDIGYNPFMGCRNLSKISVSPDHPTLAVIDGVLYNKEWKEVVCAPYQITESVIPAGIRSIGVYAYIACEYMTSVSIPDTVSYIGENSFMLCESLTSVTIPDGVPEIREATFMYCDSLSDVSIPDSVVFIGDAAFAHCVSLNAITIPDSVSFIGNAAFFDCGPNLTLTVGRNSYAESYAKENGIAYVYADDLAEEKTYTFEDYQYRLLADGTAEIINYTGQAEKLFVPDLLDGHVVTAIGDTAFQSCKGLTAVILPDSITSIGENAFTSCTGLIAVTIPNSVTSIGDDAFSYCKNLLSISIPGPVTSIGNWVFAGCENLTSFSIPHTVASIGEYAFAYCKNLTDITIPDSVCSIGERAFYSCDRMVSAEIPASVNSIGKKAFYKCGPDFVMTVARGSYAAQYAKENGLAYNYPDALDWLNN